MASLRCENLVVSFPGGVRALDDVSLEVADGELVVLVGPSGCGKSTLLRAVAGLETPASGRILLDGRDVAHLPPAGRNVAMVFQDYALYPHMTVRGNLEFPLRVRGDSREARRARVDAVAAMLGLGGILDRLPRQLSGGQRQRVAMGRALVREPAVSLLDEPLSNLDAKLRGEVRAEIAALQASTRTTMLYVTHDQVEAMTLGHRVAVLHRGVLQQVDTPARLYAKPANVFVAGFVGSPPMNLVPLAPTTNGAMQARGAVAPMDETGLPAGWTGLARQATTVGVRAEHLSLDPGGGGTAVCWRGCVEHVEVLGHENLVHVRLEAGAGRLVARTAGQEKPAPGSLVTACARAGDLHFFDEGGLALDAPGRAPLQPS